MGLFISMGLTDESYKLWCLRSSVYFEEFPTLFLQHQKDPFWLAVDQCIPMTVDRFNLEPVSQKYHEFLELL